MPKLTESFFSAPSRSERRTRGRSDLRAIAEALQWQFFCFGDCEGDPLRRQRELLPRMGKGEKFGLGLGMSDRMRAVRSHADKDGGTGEGFVSQTDDPINVGLFQIR